MVTVQCVYPGAWHHPENAQMLASIVLQLAGPYLADCRELPEHVENVWATLSEAV